VSAAQRHWDAVYAARGPDRVSWYQPEPATSLALIDDLNLGDDAAVIDVGGGASSLAARLLERGFTDVTVLDVSAQALELARTALGGGAQRVTWLEQDVLAWSPDRVYDLWHDRAVFHFLVDRAKRQRYADVLAGALRPGGRAIVATFAVDGPLTCSGLAVARYDADGLASALGPGLRPIATRREEHHTPAGTVQPFTWMALERSD
jgi:SAM-dependent methyltransferase